MIELSSRMGFFTWPLGGEDDDMLLLCFSLTATTMLHVVDHAWKVNGHEFCQRCGVRTDEKAKERVKHD